jgi:hypothetical protein
VGNWGGKCCWSKKYLENQSIILTSSLGEHSTKKT